MPILNIGSINIDHVYRLPHFAQPGETLPSLSYARGLGGKGLNQSIALMRAGAEVMHVGAIGSSDTWTRGAITSTGLCADYLVDSVADTGHAIIQVNAAGQNCIILYSGANASLRLADIASALAALPQAEWVLLQNEINSSTLAQALDLTLAQGRKVALNPAPYTADIALLPLERLAVLLLNEIEAQQLTSTSTNNAAFAALRERCPRTLIVLTLGPEGMWAALGSETWRQPALPTTVRDTTAAGDTVTGYILANLADGLPIAACLLRAAQAAAITVSRPGATDSIPHAHELSATAALSAPQPSP